VAGVNIPKIMSITPRFEGVNQFISDAKRISTEVNRMTKDVNKSLNQLGKTSTATNKITADANKMATSVNKSVGALAKTSAAVKSSTSRIDTFSKSLSSGLSSLNKWGKGFDFTNNSMRRFGTSLANVGKSITRFSFQLERVGRGMMMAFTLPAIAAGYAIVKTAMDFETALVKVENLVGVSRSVVAGWGEEILEMSTDLAAMPVDLAKGLFAAASGFGEIAAQAPVMEVLYNAGMAAAIGLGEMEDIARATTAMLNAFKNTGLDAAQATSLLVLSVREGNMEVDKLASALGNVLGVASFIGAGADDVLAFISAYTRFGVEPTRAVTALNTALTNLIKPSKTNQEILLKYGLSLDVIRQTIAGPAGLATLLLQMQQNMSEVDFISIFGIRSLKGVSAVTNAVNEFDEEYMRVAKNMYEEGGRTFLFMAAMAEKGSDKMRGYMELARLSGETAMNALEESIIRTMETLEYKFDQIKSLFSQIFIGVDSAIAPFLKEFADSIIEALEKVKEFVETNTESVKLILKIVAALAAAGPALLIFAKVFQAFGVVLTTVGSVISIFGTLIGLVVNLGVAMGILAVNVGVRVLQGFLFLGKALWGVVAPMATLLVQTAAWIAFQIGSAAVSAIGFFFGLGGAVATVAAAFVNLLLVIAPAVGAIAAVVAIIGAIGAAILVVTGALVSLGESIASAWQGVLDFFAPVKEEFERLAPEGKNWGQGLIAAFSQGIYDGLIYLVDALNAVGTIIAHWLKGMSPPRIAPDIDIWGMNTMQEWIDGWKKADFGVFNDIQSTIGSFLKSLYDSMGKEDTGKGIAAIILGSREAIANAIAEVKRFGKATKEALDSIYVAIGTTTLELENYIEATLAAAATTDILAKAQEKINDINEKYARLLSPIRDGLAAIDRERSKVSSTREIEELNKVIARGNLPDQVAALARLRIKEIGLQQEEAGLEGERDAELSVAELQLQSAEDANEIAQENLTFAQEALGLQTKGLDKLGEIMKKLDDVTSAIKSAPKAIGDAVAEAVEMEPLDLSGIPGVGGGGLDDGEDDGEGGPLSQLDAKLTELTTKLEETKVIWGEVWTEMVGDVVTWYNDTYQKYLNWRNNIADKWGASFTTLKKKGSEVWTALTTTLANFWRNTKNERADMGIWLDGLSVKFAEALPERITNFADALLVLIGVLDNFLGYAAEEGVLDTLFPMQNMETNPVAMLLDSIGTWFGDTDYDSILLDVGSFITDFSDILTGVDIGALFDDAFGGIATGENETFKGGILAGVSSLIGTYEESDFGISVANFFTDAKADVDESSGELFTGFGGGDTGGDASLLTGFGDSIISSYEGSQLQISVGAFSQAFITDWNANFAPGILDFFTKEGEIESAVTTYITGLSTQMGEDFAVAGEAINEKIKEKRGVWDRAWDLIFGAGYQGDREVPFFTGEQADKSIENMDKTGAGLTGLGLGFLTLGTDTDLSREAFRLFQEKALELKDKLIELRDSALKTLEEKVEAGRKKFEEFRLKIVAVRLWIQFLITKITTTLTTTLNELWALVEDYVIAKFDDFLVLLETIWEYIENFFGPVISGVTGLFDSFKESINNILEPLQSFVGFLGDAVKLIGQLSGKVIDWIISGGNPADWFNWSGDTNKLLIGLSVVVIRQIGLTGVGIPIQTIPIQMTYHKVLEYRHTVFRLERQLDLTQALRWQKCLAVV